MYFRMLYNMRAKYNIQSIIYSSIYFFIRNYTYSGMFRYNAHGEFNVPYGGIGYNGNSFWSYVLNSVSYGGSKKIKSSFIVL